MPTTNIFGEIEYSKEELKEIEEKKKAEEQAKKEAEKKLNLLRDSVRNELNEIIEWFEHPEEVKLEDDVEDEEEGDEEDGE